MRNLIIVYGLKGDLYWTGETWCADPRLAYRYSAGERNTLELPQGGFWTVASCYTVFTTTGKETTS